MHRPHFSVTLCGLLAATVVVGCGDGEDGAARERARLVLVEPAVEEDAVERLVLLGDVHGETEVRVFAQLPERIRTLHVTEGSRVSAGDPIATLEAGLVGSDVAQAGAALAAAEAERDRLVAEIARVEPLVAGAVLPRNQLDTLRASLRAAEARVDQLGAGRRAAGLRRAQTVVRAPAEGVVALLRVEAGDMVAPQMPLCSVVSLDRVTVELRVVEGDFVRLQEGMPVTVRPTALADVERVGTITNVSPVIDPMTRTAAVEVTLANEDRVLRPGMVAEVEVELSRRPDVVLVPSRAVVMTGRTRTDGEAVVFVADGETASRRIVKLGRRFDRRVEITEGVADGEQVVVEGQHLLRDGTLIRTPSEPRVATRAAPEAAPEPEAEATP